MTHSVSARLVRVLALFVLTSASFMLALVSFAQAEVIRSFDVEAEVEADGTVYVTETIQYDFESAQRHGIYRSFKETHPQESGSWITKRYVDYVITAVLRDGVSEPFSYQNYDGVSIRIGDANKTISGEHEYKITYKIRGIISEYDGVPELYWNVTGSDWQVPINNVSITIKGVNGTSFTDNRACYVGSYGSTGSCDSQVIEQNQTLFSVERLSPGEGITIAEQLSLAQAYQVVERTNYLPMLLVASALWLLGLVVVLWRWKFAYKRSGAVIAQYEPYKNFKPMFTGVLFDGRLDSRDIAAGIVYLAEQGFIRIRKTTNKFLFLIEMTDYEIELLRVRGEVKVDFHFQLLELLQVKEVGEKILLSDIKKSQATKKANFKVIKSLRAGVVEEMIKLGFLEQRLNRVIQAAAFPVTMFLVMFFGPYLGIFLDGYAVLFIILFILSLVIGILLGMERRTTLGYEALQYLKGFKDFLETTEKDRYAFHNAPEKSPEIFMEYLPYAIAFGVEKQWAKVFEDLDISDPDWYVGDGVGAFNAVAFTSDIGGFSTALASSGTSGSSGSSGGGFSGGGGGGGGGGSW